MAAPFGHAAIGMLVARRLGVRSGAGLAAAALAASLPDADIPLGLVVRGDAWVWHRGATHTAGFALAMGALAGMAGVISAGNAGASATWSPMPLWARPSSGRTWRWTACRTSPTCASGPWWSGCHWSTG